MVAGRNRSPRRRWDWVSWVIGIYVLGGTATAAWYTRNDESDDAYIEGIIFGLMWPLHWILELVEAILE